MRSFAGVLECAALHLLTVYYDHGCAICRDEIAAIRLADVGDRIRFVDCSAPDFVAPDPDAPTRDRLMRQLHARSADGQWRVGPAAFAQIYGVVGMPWLARLWGARWLQPLWRRLYPWIAEHRMAIARSPLAPPFLWLLRRAARRAAARRHCADGACARQDAERNT